MFRAVAGRGCVYAETCVYATGCVHAAGACTHLARARIRTLPRIGIRIWVRIPSYIRTRCVCTAPSEPHRVCLLVFASMRKMGGKNAASGAYIRTYLRIYAPDAAYGIRKGSMNASRCF